MSKPELMTDERETLLKELHQRIRNNMQIISGLLTLTFSKFDDEVKASLEDSIGRISTMSIVHEQLYEAKDLKNIASDRYINLLINDVKNRCSHNYRFQFEIYVEEFHMGLDRALPLGLIINEVLSNTFKHAFIGRENGKVFFSLKKNEKGIELVIRDNGVGIENIETLKKSNSLGFKLISGLTNQLKGHIEISIKNGMEYKIMI